MAFVLCYLSNTCVSIYTYRSLVDLYLFHRNNLRPESRILLVPSTLNGEKERESKMKLVMTSKSNDFCLRLMLCPCSICVRTFWSIRARTLGVLGISTLGGVGNGNGFVLGWWCNNGRCCVDEGDVIDRTDWSKDHETSDGEEQNK